MPETSGFVWILSWVYWWNREYYREVHVDNAFSFDLIDEPWIPCLLPGDPEVRFFGIRDSLAKAGSIREVLDASPLVTVGLHRLLLAILHRCFGPSGVGEWERMWRRGAWDDGDLAKYLDAWRARFDLFHPERPFYQTPNLDLANAVTIAQLSYELASPANKALLFDHTIAGTASFTPDRAARYLLAAQSFSVGGTISLQRHEPPSRYKFADSSPLLKGAVTLVRGGNLFETLMLNLHRYNIEDEEPFPASPDDEPAWERDAPLRVEERHPDGYLDLLTWQSRRILLFPEREPGGGVVVRKVAVMKGDQFPDVDERHTRETMLAFTRNERASSGQDPWPVIAFREGRAVWRDSTALMQSVAGSRDRPKVLSWLDQVVSSGIIPRSATLPVDLYGICTDQARLLFWRHERLPVPLAYLDSRELLEALTGALNLAEDVARTLRSSVETVAAYLLRPQADAPGAAMPPRSVTRPIADGLFDDAAYWSRLDTPFRRLIVELEADRREDPDEPGEMLYGADVLPRWADTVVGAARGSFAEAVRGAGTSARGLKAAAIGERQLSRGLGAERRKYLAAGPDQEGEED